MISSMPEIAVIEQAVWSRSPHTVFIGTFYFMANGSIRLA